MQRFFFFSFYPWFFGPPWTGRPPRSPTHATALKPDIKPTVWKMPKNFKVNLTGSGTPKMPAISWISSPLKTTVIGWNFFSCLLALVYPDSAFPLFRPFFLLAFLLRVITPLNSPKISFFNSSILGLIKTGIKNNRIREKKVMIWNHLNWNWQNRNHMGSFHCEIQTCLFTLFIKYEKGKKITVEDYNVYLKYDSCICNKQDCNLTNNQIFYYW